MKRITATGGAENTHSASFVEVNLDLIAQNLAALKERTSKAVFGVLKADAYGLGAVPIARRLQDEVAFFALATVSEAKALREAGIEKPLLVFGYVADADIAWMVDHGVRPALSDVAAAARWDAVAAARGKVAPIHLAIDTGHHRVGIDWTKPRAVDIAEKMAQFSHLRLEGAYSHFSTADEANGPREEISTAFPHRFAMEQLRRFKSAVDDMERAGLALQYRHIANDAGLLTFADDELFDAVRLGICLYGSYPSDDVGRYTDLKLSVPYRWLAPVSRVETVPAGESVSYGRTWFAERPTKVATVQVGYADGYPRLLSNRAVMLVGDVPCPVIGRVCMDQTMLDVTEAPDVQPGDLVLVMGARDWSTAEALADESRTAAAPASGEAAHGISAAYLAGLAETIAYEMTTNWHPRVERVYVGSQG